MFNKKDDIKLLEEKNKKEQEAPRKNKARRVLKIIGTALLIMMLFQIPISAINDIGKPDASPSDEHPNSDFKVVEKEPESEPVEEPKPVEEEPEEVPEVQETEPADETSSVEEATPNTSTTDVFGHTVADPNDTDTVRIAAEEWIGEGTSTEGSAFSAYDTVLPIAVNQIDLLDGYGASDLYYYIENRTSSYIKQAVFFMYYWDPNGMPIMISPNGNNSVGGDQYVDVVVQNNLAPNESIIKEDSSWLSYEDIQYIGIIPVAYETMEGEVWNNAYLTNFMEKSGSYVWEFRDVAPNAVFNFFK